MHQSFLADAHRTLDPSEAHFFYVPVYAACLIVRNFDRFDEYRRLIGSALEHIRTQHPFFNASHGADHVFLFAHDFGACLGWTSETSAVHFPAMRHAIFLTHNGDLNLGCFSPQKDIVIPPYYSDTAIAAIAQSDDRAELDGVAAAKNKTIFAYFRGTLHWRHTSDLPKLGIRKGVSKTYSQGVRQSLARQYGRDPLFLILEGADGDYFDEVQSALFCLCPRGFASWSRRLFDAIAVGCIPVIISDDAEHPFERIVDYRTFSIRIAESDLSQLKSVLLAVPPTAVQSKLDALARVAPLFAYREATHDMREIPTQVGVMYGVLMQLAVKARTTHSSAEEPWM
jgi:hypothetical protein